MREINSQVEEAEELLKKNEFNNFGKLLNEGWKLKKSLSKVISNRRIDDLYNFAIKNGALGGKLLGAGGGGFLLMYMKDKYRKPFFNNNPKLINVPFRFINEGTSVIFQDLKR